MKLLWHPNKSQLSKSVFKSGYASINFRLQFNGDSGGWGSGSSQFWCASTDSICQIRINCIQVGWHNNIHISIDINYIIIYIIYDATMILIDNIIQYTWCNMAMVATSPPSNFSWQQLRRFAKGHHRSSEAETQCLTGLVEPVPTLVEGQIAWLRSSQICQNDSNMICIHIIPYPILRGQNIGWKTNVEHIGGFLM